MTVKEGRSILERIAQGPETLGDRLDHIWPKRADEIQLRLVKTHDKEVICDQDGRVLHGVRGFRYEQADIDECPVLVVKLYVNPSGWDNKLGVISKGESANESTGFDPNL